MLYLKKFNNADTYNAWHNNTVGSSTVAVINMNYESFIRYPEALYDSEIEYLESPTNSNCYINTLYYPNQNTRVVAHAQFVSMSENTTSLYGIATLYGPNNRFQVVCTFREAFHFGLGTGWYNTINKDTNDHIFELNGNGNIIIDEKHTFLLDANNGNTHNETPEFTAMHPLLMYGSYYDTDERYLCTDHFRVYSCKIYENGELLYDLIPVRKGNIGYFYNKVNKTFFGNAGTGNFILGPDLAYKLTPIA